MDSDAKILAAMIGVVVVIFGGIFLAVYIGNRWDCAGYESATGKPTKYFGNTCYIRDSDRWYAWEEYKNRFVANGGVK